MLSWDCWELCCGKHYYFGDIEGNCKNVWYWCWLRLWYWMRLKLMDIVRFAWHWYIYVPSRGDNCRLANRQLFVLMILFGLIRSGIIGQLIERKRPTVVWHWRAQPFPFCNGNRIGVPSLGIAREGNCSLIIERGTMSNHIVKIRCLDMPPWWHVAYVGECESCGSRMVGLEVEMMKFSWFGNDWGIWVAYEEEDLACIYIYYWF